MMAMDTILDRKRVKFYRDGGSRKITPPKAWLRRLGLDDAEEGELILTNAGITLVPAPAMPRSIEDDPEFPQFLAFLSHAAVTHPETLSDATEFYARDRDLIDE